MPLFVFIIHLASSAWTVWIWLPRLDFVKRVAATVHLVSQSQLEVYNEDCTTRSGHKWHNGQKNTTSFSRVLLPIPTDT